MAEWLIEEGIAETRALLVEGDKVLAARLHWPGELLAGTLVEARLTSKQSGARRGTATMDNGTQVLVDHLPPDITEGATITLRISRAPIAERSRFKHAQGRYCDDAQDTGPPTLPGKIVRRFPTGAWEEVWHTASSGEVDFGGGSLLFHATPAMTLVDVDGSGNARELALAAVPAIAAWLPKFDLGGSIGIDFPTLVEKDARKQVDTRLAAALAGWPHERTAMNGFGFVHIVARQHGPSLLHRFATSRTGLCARMSLRQAELAEGAGPVILVTVHPALKAKLKANWLDNLARRTGRQVRIEADPSLALEGSQAQIVER